MAMLIRAKRVSDPLDERVKARFVSSFSRSGSEHEGEAVAGHPSSSLSGMIDDFFEPEDHEPSDANERKQGDNCVCEDDGEPGIQEALLLETVQGLLNPFKKPDYLFRLRLCSEVIKASESLAWLRSNGSGYRRAVMAGLRKLGYNAGICKARWEGSGGLSAGSYEYMDVVVKDTINEKYIVDLDFVAQFEVARGTAEYQKLVSVLPTVIVVKPDELRQVLRIMTEAVRRSLKSRDLSVPPWRKSRYMLAKWLGPYRRTVNPFPSGGAVVGVGEVKCRTIGFKMEPAATFLFH